MDDLALRFTEFAEKECQGSSELYRALSNATASDGELLRLAGCAPAGQPVPNLFLAAVHLLLFQGADHPLRSFYASLTNRPGAPAGAVGPFRDFCLVHADKIKAIMAARLVQTNEVRRSLPLYAAFCRVGREIPDRPIALVELGPSAGLNLLWDKYAYHLAGLPLYGDPNSPLVVSSELRGSLRPPLEEKPPAVAERIGIDLNPILASDDEGLEWLTALIWPEHADRRARLQSALAVLRQNPVQILRGDGVALLPMIVERIPEGTTPCVYHTFVANQLSEESRQSL